MRTHSNRSRAPSDPFLDTSPGPSASPHSFGPSLETKHNPEVSGSTVVPSPPTSIQIEELLKRTAGGSRMYTPSLASEAFDSRAQLRIWTAPSLSNPEFMSLLSIYPPFLTRRTLPRFLPSSNVNNKSALTDIEAGIIAGADFREEIRVGTGVLWIGSQERSGPWRGSWWERFKAWIRRLIG